MLDLNGLKREKELLAAIDWDMTPKEAFESYQLRSAGNWRSKDLPEVVYFYLSTWQGKNRVMLVRRHYVESEELAELALPPELESEVEAAGQGEQYPRGQLPLTGKLRDWLQRELEV